MTIKIKKFDSVGIRFWIPTSFLKSKIIKLFIQKYCHDENIMEILNIMPIIYNSLKEYIKVNGHFKLIEIEDNDGDLIIIKV